MNVNTATVLHTFRFHSFLDSLPPHFIALFLLIFFPINVSTLLSLNSYHANPKSLGIEFMHFFDLNFKLTFCASFIPSSNSPFNFKAADATSSNRVVVADRDIRDLAAIVAVFGFECTLNIVHTILLAVSDGGKKCRKTEMNKCLVEFARCFYPKKYLLLQFWNMIDMPANGKL